MPSRTFFSSRPKCATCLALCSGWRTAWRSTVRAELSRSLRRMPMTGFRPRVLSEACRCNSSLFLLLIYDAPLS
ncbi:hypothetical protein D3C73_1398410 [compost metagenome]